MTVDLNQLQVLAAVAKHGTMTGAAEELLYTPSAISQQIKRLESEVRVQVLERHARGVILTEAGKLIVARAEVIQAQIQGLKNDLEDLAGARAGSLRLGVFPTFAASILPAVMIRFRAMYPNINLEIQSSREAPLRELLESREVDMTLVWDYPWNRVNDPGLVTKPLMLDRTVLLLPQSHRLAARSLVSIADLSEERWVVRAQGHPTREVIERCGEANGFKPQIAVETNDYPELQAMIAAGLGVSLCPALAIQPLRSDVVVRQVESSVPSRQISTAYATGRQPSAAQHAMTLTLEDVVTSLGLASVV